MWLAQGKLGWGRARTRTWAAVPPTPGGSGMMGGAVLAPSSTSDPKSPFLSLLPSPHLPCDLWVALHHEGLPW